jgi:Na+/H+ antiporter NhaD/arsenite permease-like protein
VLISTVRRDQEKDWVLNSVVFVSAVFVLVYAILAFQKEKRARVVWVGVALFVIFNAVFAEGRFWHGLLDPLRDVNWNVIGIFIGTFLVAESFTVSLVPRKLANTIVRRSGSVGVAIVLIAGLAGILSAFVENVATVLILAPIAVEMANRLKVSPVPFLISIAVSSNLQGTATLIGDPPSMILAAHMKLNFNDFFWLQGKPGIFFAVEIGAVASMVVLWLMFRKYKEPVEEPEPVEVKSWTPTYLLAGMIVALALSPLLDPEFLFLAGAVCMVFGLIARLWERKFSTESRLSYVRTTLRQIDWDTTLFLIGIFVFVGVLSRTGVIEMMAEAARGLIGSNVFFGFSLIVWFSVLVSAFVDNVPYITAMLPVSTILAEKMSISLYLFPFGLLIGSCLGGNITPIGAAANIVAVGYLARCGHKTSFIDFVKIGLPFTLAATAAGSAFLWLFWG